MKKIVGHNKIADARMETFGIATILIILVHAKSYNWELYPSFLYKICELGSIGVDIFLFLSGMGLYYSMSKCKSVKEFYRRRMIRVLPSYIAIAGILYGIMLFLHNISAADYLLHVSTLYMWIRGASVTWYVSFLLLLYVVYPLLYKVLVSKKWIRNILIVFGTVIIFEICLFIFAKDFYLYYEYAWSRIPIFMIGVIWGKQEFDGKGYSPWSMLIYGMGGVGVRIGLLLLGSVPADLYQVGIRISYILGTLFIVEFVPAIKKWMPNNFVTRILRILGKVSLEVYLVHALYSQIFQCMNWYRSYNTPVSYLIFVVVPSIAVVLCIQYILQMIRMRYDKKRV